MTVARTACSAIGRIAVSFVANRIGQLDYFFPMTYLSAAVGLALWVPSAPLGLSNEAPARAFSSASQFCTGFSPSAYISAFSPIWSSYLEFMSDGVDLELCMRPGVRDGRGVDVGGFYQYKFELIIVHLAILRNFNGKETGLQDNYGSQLTISFSRTKVRHRCTARSLRTFRSPSRAKTLLTQHRKLPFPSNIDMQPKCLSS